ncbi:GNAT family N-acetyltransferase [Microlunatus speluncae]|uniref:GNAT family N-acetyltransferase n=1 Tax=Microlunatus speluncae TaxID=2594267 RepID=UPI00126650FC|nr:GNAT family N-acetyltransferase [Microlunatus speluncae]
MEITIQPATVEDVDHLVWVCCGTGEQQYADGYRQDALEQVRGEVANSITSVIRADGTAVGRLRVVRTPELVEIAGIQIHPTWQNRGIGTEVITTIVREAGRPVELEVSKVNPNAERLYRRLGFRRVGDTEHDYRMRR